VWKLPSPWKGSPKRIALTVTVLTGMEVDEGGTVRLLDPKMLGRRRQQLERLGGPMNR
jgi:hypothetical protein